jgi:hypothetical protein
LTIISAALLFASTQGWAVRELKQFGDWVVGCDNGRDCHAASLPADEGLEEPLGDGDLTMSIRRSGNAYEAALLGFTAANALPLDYMTAMDRQMEITRRIAVGDKKLNIRLVKNAGIYGLDAHNSAKVIAAMRNADTVSLLDMRGKSFATISLRGVNQVLQYIDERQYLTGTVAALFRRGKRPVNAFTVPPMAPRQRITVAGKPDMQPSTVDEMQLAQLRATDPCLQYSKDEPPGAPSYYRLDVGNTLMILPTVCGGYNPYSMLFIVDENGAAQRARFWPYPGNDMKEGPDLPDTWWDEKTRLLNSFGRGRVLSDCGESQDYAWYEGRFKLVHFSSMSPCRGSTDYITTYRVEVVIDNDVKPAPATSRSRGFREPENLEKCARSC